MNTSDKEEITSRYRARLAQHGTSIAALASGDIRRREIRFGRLADVGITSGCSVLDLGCGFADFLDYLKHSGVEVNYTGYDIMPEFIDIARARHPEARFEVRDIQNEGITGEFDFVVSSQTFNNRYSGADNLDVIREVLRLTYGAARQGVVVDMLTSYVDFREPHLFYYSPEEMFSFAKTLTKRVTLRHESPLYEFALYLYKDFDGWKK